MSKFDEILNSSDASDALLGEQIDKLSEKVEDGTDYEVVLLTDIIDFKSGFTATGNVRRYGRVYTGWMYIKGTFEANKTVAFGTGKIGNFHLYAGGGFCSSAEWSVTNGATTYVYIGGTGNTCVVGCDGSPATTGVYVNFMFSI